MLTGIDLSHWNSFADYSVLNSSGLSFAFIKATQGTGIVDPAMEKHYNGISPTHLLTGFYHFYIVASDPTAQAQHFCDTIKPNMDAFSLPPVLDLEDETTTIPVATLVANVQTFLAKVQELSGCTPIVYTGRGFMQGKMANSNALANYPLWDACYEKNPATPYGGWAAPKIWQYTDKSTNSGQPTDGDLWYGDAADMLSFTQSTTFKDGSSPADWTTNNNIKVL